jgi:alpha-L-fucosidase
LNNLKLYGYKGKIKYAQFLHDNSEIRFQEEQNTENVNLSLPVLKPNYEIPVIELILQ